jgi:hypothetical protein
LIDWTKWGEETRENNRPGRARPGKRSARKEVCVYRRLGAKIGGAELGAKIDGADLGSAPSIAAPSSAPSIAAPS